MNRDGYVLVAVLAVLALLAALVGVIALLVRPSVESARLAADGLVVDGLVGAGVELAAYQLFALHLPVSEVDSRRVRLDAGVITLFVEAEGGKVDLNGASPELLASAFRAARLASMKPEVFADRVVDWRDQDSERSPNGAEAVDYGRAGLAGRPPNAPFRSVDELQSVLGMTLEAVLALVPFVTVDNPAGKIVVADASRSLLSALPGMTAAKADQVIAMRGGGSQSAGVATLGVLGSAAAFVQSEPVASYRVTIEVSQGNSIIKRVQAVLIAPGSADLYKVADWIELPRDPVSRP